MSSVRETALQAVMTALGTLTDPVEPEGDGEPVPVEDPPTILRNAVIPEAVPAGGLLILRDGDPGEPEYTLSPTRYEYEHEASLEVLVQEATAAARDSALDALLGEIATALAGVTLTESFDHIEVGAPVRVDAEVTGAEDISGAVVPLILSYTTTHPLQ